MYQPVTSNRANLRGEEKQPKKKKVLSTISNKNDNSTDSSLLGKQPKEKLSIRVRLKEISKGSLAMESGDTGSKVKGKEKKGKQRVGCQLREDPGSVRKKEIARIRS